MAAILWVFNSPSHDNAAEARLFLKTRMDLTVPSSVEASSQPLALGSWKQSPEGWATALGLYAGCKGWNTFQIGLYIVPQLLALQIPTWDSNEDVDATSNSPPSIPVPVASVVGALGVGSIWRPGGCCNTRRIDDHPNAATLGENKIFGQMPTTQTWTQNANTRWDLAKCPNDIVNHFFFKHCKGHTYINGISTTSSNVGCILPPHQIISHITKQNYILQLTSFLFFFFSPSEALPPDVARQC